MVRKGAKGIVCPGVGTGVHCHPSIPRLTRSYMRTDGISLYSTTFERVFVCRQVRITRSIVGERIWLLVSLAKDFAASTPVVVPLIVLQDEVSQSKANYDDRHPSPTFELPSIPTDG